MGVFAALQASLAWAGDFNAKVSLEIPSQNLASALTALADQADLQILFSPDLVSRKQVAALSGEYSGSEALQRMLVGANLDFVVDGRDTVIIRSRNAPTFNRIAQQVAPAAQVIEPSEAVSTTGVVALEEVLVTGSRVITNGNNSPMPVTVVTTESLDNVQPATLADGLNILPVFSGSRGQASNPSATGSVGAGNGVANTLNLRNIGANRNLILLDGLRVPPTLISGAVDVDMIPEMLIQRVDMVTGGVSAVYGSDAVTGVVNFVTDKNFNGLKANVLYGQSGHGDGDTFEAGVAFGTVLFDGRGHIEGSFQHRDDRGVLFRSSRYNQPAIEGQGTGASPFRLYENVRLIGNPFGGVILGGALNDQVFRTDGVLSSFAHGAATGSACCEVGGDGGYYDASLKAPLKSEQFFGRFDYEFNDQLSLYVVGSGNLKTNKIFVEYPIITNFTLSAQNAFLAPVYRNQLAVAGQTTIRLGKLISNAPRYNPVADSDQYLFIAGLDGQLGDYDWGLSYTRGMARLSTTLKNNVNNERLAAAMDAVVNSNSQIVCNTDLTNTGLRPGCVPINLFGPTAASAAAINYVLGETLFVGDTVTDGVGGQITGSPFDTWAGPFNLALSGEWRRISFKATSDGKPEDFANCAGLRFNCTQGTTRLWAQTFPQSPKVSQTVTEGAIEFDAPLLSDWALAQSFNLNGAARYTHYDTSGNYWTWKLGVDWRLNDALRFRGTRSRDIRAPTLNDLYAPLSSNPITSQDLLTGLTPRVPAAVAGNPNLTAEIGATTTVGVVWKATSELTLSVDAYQIKISDAITPVQGFNPIFQRACYASGGSSPYCLQQTRPNGFTDTSPANTVTAWGGGTINIAEITTKGVDVEANYSNQFWDRPVSLRFLASYQPHIYYAQPSLTTLDQAGVAFGANGLTAAPVWRLTGLVNIKVTDAFSVDIVQRWRNAMTMSPDKTQVWFDDRVDAYGTTGVNLSYDLEKSFGRAQLFLNVQNLFDQKPPLAASPANAAIPGQREAFVIGDDPVGRYFTLGIRFKR